MCSDGCCLGLRRAAMITCGSSYVNNNFVSRRLRPWWDRLFSAVVAVKAFRFKMEVCRTYSQDKRKRAYFHGNFPLWLKSCERFLKVLSRVTVAQYMMIKYDKYDRISHSQKTWPLWDCERFAKDFRKGSFLEPLFSPTLPYSCIDRTGSTDQLVSRNFVRRSSKGKVLNLYDFLLANILKINIKLRSNSAWFSLRNVDRILTGKLLAGKERSGSCRVSFGPVERVEKESFESYW